MNHAIFKCALFMGVGILDHEAGSRDIRILSGMRQLFPENESSHDDSGSIYGWSTIFKWIFK